jgi:hypothetical protein
MHAKHHWRMHLMYLILGQVEAISPATYGWLAFATLSDVAYLVTRQRHPVLLGGALVLAMIALVFQTHYFPVAIVLAFTGLTFSSARILGRLAGASWIAVALAALLAAKYVVPLAVVASCLISTAAATRVSAAAARGLAVCTGFLLAFAGTQTFRQMGFELAAHGRLTDQFGPCAFLILPGGLLILTLVVFPVIGALVAAATTRWRKTLGSAGDTDDVERRTFLLLIGFAALVGAICGGAAWTDWQIDSGCV